jgi:glycosyltransferase involved in cell wall biosynthesis
MNVSYAILTHNEGKSIEALLKKLRQFKLPGDEIVVVDDLSTDLDTLEILERYQAEKVIDRMTIKPLNNNFANQKNFLASLCEKEYVFNIDADEVPSDDLMRFLHMTLDMNQEVDMYAVPRCNTVSNIGLSHVEEWKWAITSFPNLIEEKLFDLDNPQDANEYRLLKKFGLIIEED